jgi:hypothetical protein
LFILSLVYAGMSGGRDVLNGSKGQGSEGTEVDEGCNRVMEDRAKWKQPRDQQARNFIMRPTNDI